MKGSKKTVYITSTYT